tara:strand:+ start:257 stop:652 length:396 start_codon:yes stop_codon:yes gene_type:complete
MKKILLSALMLCMASCASIQVKQSHITVDNLAEKCQISERWDMSLMGVGAIVGIYSNCYEYNKLLMIIVQKKPTHAAEIQTLTGKLLLKHFLWFAHQRDEKHNWKVKPIKTELGENWTVFYYDLIQSKKEK